jgi:hypothetical protein
MQRATENIINEQSNHYTRGGTELKNIERYGEQAAMQWMLFVTWKRNVMKAMKPNIIARPLARPHKSSSEKKETKQKQRQTLDNTRTRQQVARVCANNTAMQVYNR